MSEILSEFEQYQNALDNSTIVLKVDAGGIIKFANSEFCKASGFLASDLIGQKRDIIKLKDENPDKMDEIWKIVAKKRIYKGVLCYEGENHDFYLDTTITPILGANGEVIEFVEISRDVTELFLKRAELKLINSQLQDMVEAQTQKLLNLNKNLESKVKEEVEKNEQKTRIMFQQSRLASMGEMIGNIAHQWRQPLSELGIDLFKMKQNRDDAVKFNEAYEHAKLVIKGMSNTIEDFRSFFNVNKEREIFYAKDVVRDAFVMMIGSLKKEKIKLNIDVKNDAKLYGFKSELTQVFTNLIANAKDALKPQNIRDKFIQITILESQNEAIIVVYNNASKIDKENLYKIFEPYFTTKHQSQGTGLGLYMSKMIVEHMNGKIAAKNRNNGVEFTIKFPIYKEEKVGNE